MLRREDVVDLANEESDVRNRMFYAQKEWQRVNLNRPYPGMTRVEFDKDEEAMIREMAHKIGYPKEDVVRMAVRDMYMRCCVGR